MQAKGHQREALGLGAGSRRGTAQPPVGPPGTAPPRAYCCLLGGPRPHPGHAHRDMPGPGIPGAGGSSRRGLQKSECLSKGTKTFCLTKASAGGERPGPFLFKSLYFPAAGLVILFFPIINGPSCSTGKKKNHLPGLGRGLLQPQPPGRPPAADKGGSSLRHPLGEAPEPLP